MGKDLIFYHLDPASISGQFFLKLKNRQNFWT